MVFVFLLRVFLKKIINVYNGFNSNRTICLQEDHMRIKGEDASSDESSEDSCDSDDGERQENIWMEGCFCRLENFCELYVETLGVGWRPKIQLVVREFINLFLCLWWILI